MGLHGEGDVCRAGSFDSPSQFIDGSLKGSRGLLDIAKLDTRKGGDMMCSNLGGILKCFLKPIGCPVAASFLGVIERVRNEIRSALQENIGTLEPSVGQLFAEAPRIAPDVLKFARWPQVRALFKEPDIGPIHFECSDQIKGFFVRKARKCEVSASEFHEEEVPVSGRDTGHFAERLSIPFGGGEIARVNDERGARDADTVLAGKIEKCPGHVHR